MSMNMHEDETEVAEGFTRVLRTAMMSLMQVREARERKQQQIEKASEKQLAEIQAEQKRVDMTNQKVAGAIHRDMQSQMFWNHASNDRIAQQLITARALAGQHPDADAAYMLGVDVARDRFNVNLDKTIKGAPDGRGQYEALLQTLDDYNAAGRLRTEADPRSEAGMSPESEQKGEARVDAQKEQRLREEAELSDVAAESSAQDVDASVADRTPSPHLLTAADSEAAQVGLTPEVYVDRLTDEQRTSLVNDYDRGIEDSLERDERLESAQSAQADAPASELPEKTYDTKAEVAKDDAALARKSEVEHLGEAAKTQSESGHQSAMDKHLESVAAKDPQAAASRRQSLKNVNGSKQDYVKSSMDSKASPRKAAAQKQAPSREHVHQR